MAVMGLRLAGHANGVSRLHGQVSRGMFHGLWPDRPVSEVPIGHITNGVHEETWTAPEILEIVAPALHSPDPVGTAGALDDAHLWAARRTLRARLVDEIRARRRASFLGAGADASTLGWIDDAFDPDVLTIGFARRVPQYKRLTLILHDPERLRGLLLDHDRPVQLVVAGKAHPADEGGKDVMQDVIEFSRSPLARGRVVFLPDYEMTLARRLVQGVDVWLNTPCRPQEASGTSGMKAALNGVLNASILDGWWAEAFDPAIGFAIGGDETADDARDADALYRALEEQVVPAFYERDAGGLPRRWLELSRAAIARVGAEFTTGRMVAEYAERYYLPAHRDAVQVTAASRAA
jgi:starch phosphorylase